MKSTSNNKQYQREKIQLSLGATALELVLNLVLAFSGASIAIAAWAGTFSANRWVELALFAAAYALILEAVALPLSFYRGFTHEHKWELSTQTFGNWVLKRLKAYAIGTPFGALLLGGLYAIIWWTPQYWWLVAAAALLFVSLGLQRIVPILIIPFMYKVEPITEGELFDRLSARARKLGFEIKQLSRIVMSDETKKSNAFIMGIGKSKRVMLFDTLIRDFTVDEVDEDAQRARIGMCRPGSGVYPEDLRAVAAVAHPHAIAQRCCRWIADVRLGPHGERFVGRGEVERTRWHADSSRIRCFGNRVDLRRRWRRIDCECAAGHRDRPPVRIAADRQCADQILDPNSGEDDLV